MKEDDDMSAVLEKMIDQRNTGDWRKNFWHVLADNENPSWELTFQFGTEDKWIEAHSLVGIITYLLDDSYYDVDEIDTKQMMLFDFVNKKILQYLSDIKQKTLLKCDVYMLSGGNEMERFSCSNCLKCRFYAEDNEGIYCKADMRNIDHTSEHAKSCNDFLPVAIKQNQKKNHMYHEVKSIFHPQYL